MRIPSDIEKTALEITKAVGSPASILTHSILFIGSFALAFFSIVEFDRMLLVLTTIVSLEAIYLAIFIQMTINYQSESIAEVSHDVEELTEDVEEISEDVGEIQEDVEELQEDVEEMTEEEESEEQAEEKRKKEQRQQLEAIHHDLQRLLIDIEKLKANEKK